MTGLELKLLRVRLGLRHYQLGDRLGVHPSRLSEMERGQRPVPPILAQILARLESQGSGPNGSTMAGIRDRSPRVW